MVDRQIAEDGSLCTLLLIIFHKELMLVMGIDKVSDSNKKSMESKCRVWLTPATENYNIHRFL